MDDDYTRPKDALSAAWDHRHRSPLHTNFYSDEDDDEDSCYSTPYQSVPNAEGVPGILGQQEHKNDEDIYELKDPSHTPSGKTRPDYDLPPPPVNAAYNHLNLKTNTQYSNGKKSEDHYNTAALNQEQGIGHQARPNRVHRRSPARDKIGASKELWACPAREPRISPGRELSASPNGERGLRRASPVLRQGKPSPTPRKPHQVDSPAVPEHPQGPVSRSSPQSHEDSRSASSPDVADTSQKPFSRQRVIYPRKGSGVESNFPAQPLVPSAPPVYEEAWDTRQQQQKLKETVRWSLARSISSTSEKFEDALEYLPEDWAPNRSKTGSCKKTESSPASSTSVSSSSITSSSSSSRTSGRSKTVDPVSGGTYEPAWDLNKGLEEKLRSIQMMHSDPAAESEYQEPWDTAQKQRELEEKIQQARSGGANTNSGSRPGSNAGILNNALMDHDQKQNHADHSSPKHEQKRVRNSSGKGGEGDVYEDAWDTRQGLAKLLGAAQGNTNTGYKTVGSAHYGQFSTGAVGERINAIIPLQNQDWYHSNISRDDAEKILRVCKDSSYLVRDSSDRCHYTLSIKGPNQMIHIQIDQCHKPDGSMRYILGKNSKAFKTIPEMIDYYTQYPVPIHGAEHMVLLHPIACGWSHDE